MTYKEPKFTPGPWVPGRNPAMATVLYSHEGKAIYPKGSSHHIAWANVYDEEGELCMDEALANARLIAAAPELYDNEEKNLTMLKTILECYQDVGKLMMTDKDVQATIQNENINGIMMPEVIHLITEDLKTRITETERALAKVMGDSNNA